MEDRTSHYLTHFFSYIYARGLFLKGWQKVHRTHGTLKMDTTTALGAEKKKDGRNISGMGWFGCLVVFRFKDMPRGFMP